MKLRLLVLLVVALLPMASIAQVSCLTIFSEDGDKFTLYLNGQQQNNVPQANLRIDGLTQPYYKARIVFEDKAKGQVSKDVQVVDPMTNANADVVYRIKNKDGEMKLRYYSAQPVPPSYNPPPDQYVMHYGQPDQTTVTQTTVTQTTGTNTTNGSVSIGFGAGGGGVNMNVNVNDPNMNGGVQQTTTTTTTTSSYSNTSGNYSNNPNNNYSNQPVNSGCQYPMDWNNFKSAKQTVANASFDETKLSTAKTILTSNCFNTDQVVEICKLFGFEASKLDFAKYAYSRTTDPGNYFKVSNVFSFDASKTDLNNYISGNR